MIDLWGANSISESILVLNNIKEFKYIVERDLDNYVGLSVTSKDNTSILYHFMKSVFKCKDHISDLKIRFREDRLNDILDNE